MVECSLFSSKNLLEYSVNIVVITSMFAMSIYARFDEAVMQVVAARESTYSDLIRYQGIIDKNITSLARATAEIRLKISS